MSLQKAFKVAIYRGRLVLEQSPIYVRPFLISAFHIPIIEIGLDSAAGLSPAISIRLSVVSRNSLYSFHNFPISVLIQ